MEVMVPGFGPVREARGFWGRWRGLRHSPDGAALLLRAGSVHGFGMDRPILVVGLDRRFTVVGVSKLVPNRIVRMRGARWIVELPETATPPPVGTRLTANG